MLDGAADHRERGAQLVARVGRELALAAQGGPLGVERVADRHEGPAGVDGAERHGDEDHDPAADEQHAQERVERLLLGRAVLDHLDVDRPDRRIDPLGHRPDRQRSRSWRAGRRCRRSPRPRASSATGRPSGMIWPRATLLPFASTAIANVPLELPPKMNPYSGPGRPRGFWMSWVIWVVRFVSCWTPFAWSVVAATQYIAKPRTRSTTRVDRPLHRTSRQRTVRISRLSAAMDSASARIEAGRRDAVRHR